MQVGEDGRKKEKEFRSCQRNLKGTWLSKHCSEAAGEWGLVPRMAVAGPMRVLTKWYCPPHTTSQAAFRNACKDGLWTNGK